MTPVHSGTQTEDPQHVSSSRGSGSLPIAQRDTIDVVYTWVYGQGEGLDETGFVGDTQSFGHLSSPCCSDVIEGNSLNPHARPR